MAVAFGNTTNDWQADDTSSTFPATPAKPANAVDGSLVILAQAIHSQVAGAFNADIGGTPLTLTVVDGPSNSPSSFKSGVQRRAGLTADGTPYNCNCDSAASAQKTAMLLAFTGHNVSTPIRAVGTTANGTSTAPQCPDTASASVGDMVVRIMTYDDDGDGLTVTRPGGSHTAGPLHQPVAASGKAIAIDFYVVGSAGAPGTATYGLSLSRQWTASTIVIQADGAAGTTITPTVGALTLTGIAPVVTQQANRIPVAGALALTGIAALVTQQAIRIPTAGALTLTGVQPSVSAGGNVSRIPVTGALAISGVAPDLTLTLEAPTAAGLALNGQTPILTQNINRLPLVGALALSGVAPVVTQQINRVPVAGALTLTGVAPAVLGVGTITPGTGSLTMSGVAPVVTVPLLITPNTGALAFNGVAPVLVFSSPVIRPDTGSIVITGYAPTGLGGGVSPGLGSTGISRPGISDAGVAGISRSGISA